MRLPGESIAELNTSKRAWELLEPWGRTQQNTTIERHAVYTFEAKWAHQWRKDRLLLAGDAAHLMPPFAGQGMCGGMRDLANLVWKLALVLRDQAPDDLLDTYGSERATNVQHFIHLSMALGQIICVLDEDAAGERDRRMIAGGADPANVLPEGPPPRLGPGALTDDPTAGLAMVQGRVARDGDIALFDTIVEPGFVLLGADAMAVAEIDEAARAALARLGGGVEHVGAGGLEDVDGVYGRWFGDANAAVVLLRPDHYVFGTAATAAEAPALVAELQRAVTAGGVRA
jgi:hypothetical protein